MRSAPIAMHVAFFATYGLWTPHMGTELELAEQHLRDGDEVTWVVCDGSLPACDSNPRHVHVDCLECRWKVASGLNALSGDVRRIRLRSLLRAEDRRRMESLPTRFESARDLEELEFDGFDAGWAALSSTVWTHRDVDVDLNDGLALAYLRASVRAYLAAQELFRRHEIDRIYAFNGRMAPLRGVLRAAEREGVPCHVHERGRDLQHYSIFEGCLPHDIGRTTERVHRTWETSELSEEEKREVADGWFEARSKGRMGSWFSFLDDQQPDAVPEGWSEDVRNVVFYTSSEYEFAAIGEEWRSGLFEGPTDAAVRTAEALSAREGVHTTIRVHPNPDSDASSSVQRLLDLDLPRVTVVPPRSEVSSYALMQAADVVVTAGSTAGIEASYWGKPSVLLGRAMYSGLGAVHEPATRDAALAQILDPDLATVPRDAALRYGFYLATLGTPFRYFEGEDVFHGKFRGAAVRPTRWQRKVIRFLKKRAGQR